MGRIAANELSAAFQRIGQQLELLIPGEAATPANEEADASAGRKRKAGEDADGELHAGAGPAAGGKKGKKKGKAGEDGVEKKPRPSRLPTEYNNFVRKELPSYRRSHPEMAMPEVMKQISQLWRNRDQSVPIAEPVQQAAEVLGEEELADDLGIAEDPLAHDTGIPDDTTAAQDDVNAPSSAGEDFGKKKKRKKKGADDTSIAAAPAASAPVLLPQDGNPLTSPAAEPMPTIQDKKRKKKPMVVE
eukprot:jgi/Chlat1/4653/Chrsp3S05604